ncbi:MAG TPA: hypothetical protein VHY91_26780 [Pirellulales bacterium]|nr:hypothetical protein [Pirellulales bacterium]
MQSLENAEQLVGVAHVDARPVVANEVDPLGAGFAARRRGAGGRQPGLAPAADFDPRRLSFAGVFQGVGDQVCPNLPRQVGSPAAGPVVAALDRYRSFERWQIGSPERDRRSRMPIKA